MSPRKPKVLQTDDTSRERFALWLRAAKEGVYQAGFADSNGVGVRGHQFGDPITQAQMAGAAAISDRHLRDLLSGAVGPSVDKAWDIGEAIATFKGREWCAGVLAVAAVQIYRIHVLRWIATLLRQEGPTDEIRAMWPLIENLATEPALFARPYLLHKWTQQQRLMSARAWVRRGAVDDPIPTGTPAMLAAAVALQNAMGHSGDLTLTIAASAMHEALHAWFQRAERDWDRVRHGETFP